MGQPRRLAAPPHIARAPGTHLAAHGGAGPPPPRLPPGVRGAARPRLGTVGGGRGGRRHFVRARWALPAPAEPRPSGRSLPILAGLRGEQPAVGHSAGAHGSPRSTAAGRLSALALVPSLCQASVARAPRARRHFYSLLEGRLSGTPTLKYLLLIARDVRKRSVRVQAGVADRGLSWGGSNQ